MVTEPSVFELSRFDCIVNINWCKAPTIKSFSVRTKLNQHTFRCIHKKASIGKCIKVKYKVEKIYFNAGVLFLVFTKLSPKLRSFVSLKFLTFWIQNHSNVSKWRNKHMTEIHKHNYTWANNEGYMYTCIKNAHFLYQMCTCACLCARMWVRLCV